MDEYIDQPLAEMQTSEPAQKIVRNILDEPIPETVKRRLLKPLFPRKYRPVRPPPTWKDRESKEFEEEQKKRQVFYRTPWAIGNYLRAWQMDVSAEHPLAADPREFLEGVRQRIREKLTEEVSALDGVKFQLALKVSLRKQGADGTEELTDPVLHHKQKALFQASEIKQPLTKPYPISWSCSKSGCREVRGG